MDKICNTEACKWIGEHPPSSDIIVLYAAVYSMALIFIALGLYLCYYAYKRCTHRNNGIADVENNNQRSRREGRDNAAIEWYSQEVHTSRESNSQTIYCMPPNYGDLFPNGPPRYPYYAVSHI